ncbi:MAG: response regulator [Myxococcales bacterium]|nr:response regulator [Myxococcales bacterium]MCB9519388.1 response regulator [Myxococcales bacterium]MCB9531287.1 response regulator [Myxococcales bacterium]
MLRCVLLVDDDSDIRLVGELALAAVGGLETHLADSGHEALRIARDVGPDLILLDVMMPKMDGPATLAALRADPSLATIPVAFCTARAQQHEVEALRALGAIGVIAKPFDPMTLAAQARELYAGATSGP